ncbi:MAG TPA: secretin N-terminal domain-containing protein [Acidobacteriota bacterium]|nr:secretin N-terminal domain-containing protein [Acidobacteriota bacterium]
MKSLKWILMVSAAMTASLSLRAESWEPAAALTLFQESSTADRPTQQQEDARRQQTENQEQEGQPRDASGRFQELTPQQFQQLTPQEKREYLRQRGFDRSTSPQAQIPTTLEELEERQRQLERLRQANQANEAGVPAAAANPAPKTRSSTTDEGSLALELEGSPIETLVSIVMNELGYSYVLDPSVTGTVTVNMRSGVPRHLLLEFLGQILQMNGFAIVERGPEFFAIVPLSVAPRIPGRTLVNPRPPAPAAQEETGEEPPPGEGAAGEQPPGVVSGVAAAPGIVPSAAASPVAAAVPQTAGALPAQQPTPQPGQAAAQQQQPSSSEPEVLGTSGPSAAISDEQGVITYVIPLNFVPASEFLKMAQVYMSDGATVVDFAPANMIMITDYRANIQQVLNLVDLLDTRYFDINNIDLIPIRFHQAVDVAEDLGKIFAPDNTAAGVRIVAIERLNSILIVTHGPDVLAEVTKWIERLDSPSSTSNVKTYIYQVENSTADNIAAILAELYGDGFGLPSAASARTSGEDPQSERGRQRQQAGFTPDSQSRTRSEQGLGRLGERGGLGGSQQLGPSLRGRPTAAEGISSAVSVGNTKIIVNNFNNSLIIQSTEADYKYLLDTIRQLDVLPRQVVIEAQIYRVELNDNLSFGVQAFLEERGFVPGDGGTQGPATTGSISGGALNAATRMVIGNTRQLRFAINALRAETDVQMVDAPQVMTMDGIQASINIGAEVPVSTSSFSDPLQSGNTGFVNQIQFRPTGTTLLIVPRVSASGNVTLELSLEVSQSSTTGTEDRLTPTINRSFIETTLICRDGLTVAIGGIISEAETYNRDRVPLLGDIPVLGALFGNTRREQSRSELIFMITPRVVQSLPTAAELTLEFQRALRNTYQYIQEIQGAKQDLIEERRQQELQQRRQQNNN